MEGGFTGWSERKASFQRLWLGEKATYSRKHCSDLRAKLCCEQALTARFLGDFSSNCAILPNLEEMEIP